KSTHIQIGSLAFLFVSGPTDFRRQFFGVLVKSELGVNRSKRVSAVADDTRVKVLSQAVEQGAAPLRNLVGFDPEANLDAVAPVNGRHGKQLLPRFRDGDFTHRLLCSGAID